MNRQTVNQDRKVEAGVPVSEMTAAQRRELVKSLSREVATWSAELNRRLA